MLTQPSDSAHTATFEMNGKTYSTNPDTLAVLRSIIPPAKTANDFSAVAAIMHFGLLSGRILETT